MSTGSHFESEFLHNPIVYGVARLLYGVATSDSVNLGSPGQVELPETTSSFSQAGKALVKP